MFILKTPFLSADLYEYTEQGKNSLAFFCAISSIVSFWYLIFNKNKIFYLVLFIINFYALIYTQSRGSLIVCILSVLLVYIYNISKQKNRLQKVAKNLSYVLAILFISIFFLDVLNSTYFSFLESYVERFSKLSGGDITQAESLRSSLINNAWETFLLNPFIGIGTHNFLSFNGYLTHNQYLQLASENGFFISLLFVVVLFRYILRFFKYGKYADDIKVYYVLFSIIIFVTIYFLFINAFDNTLILSCLMISILKLDNVLKKRNEKRIFAHTSLDRS